jgi:hypothetical protein
MPFYEWPAKFKFSEKFTRKRYLKKNLTTYPSYLMTRSYDNKEEESQFALQPSKTPLS